MSARYRQLLTTKANVLLIAVCLILAAAGVGVSGAADTQQTFSYDSLNRLTRVVYDNKTTVTYIYDKAGNRLSKTVTPSQQQTLLTLIKEGTGDGTVGVSSGTLSWAGNIATALYDLNTRLQVTATQSTGSTFDGWIGCDTTSANVCSVTMTTDRSVTAKFNSPLAPVTLTVNKTGTGNGDVTVTPGTLSWTDNAATEKYKPNSTVTLTATAIVGSTFDGWTGCDSASANVCSVNMTANKSVTARFTSSAPLTLTVIKSGTGKGNVAVSSGNLSWSDNTATVKYEGNTTITVKETANRGSTFDGWTGCDSFNADNQCTVTMTKSKAVEVVFSSSDTSNGPIYADLDGDGKSDILWYNEATGVVYIWLMDDTKIKSGASPAVLGDRNWQILGIGDFDGDGKSDILWYNKSTFMVYIWFMDGTTIQSKGSPATLPDGHWQIKSVGDFNNDGRTDILFYNESTGMVYIWLMSGRYISSSSDSPGIVGDKNWQIKGTGDFNGDGKRDILWQNISNGEVYIWLMDGAKIKSGGSPGTVSDKNWQIKGIGDFNGDGKSDILWQNTSSGMLYIWFMSDTKPMHSSSPGTVGDKNWQIKSIGYFNGDIMSDILWQNISGGDLYIWLMDGTGAILDKGSPATLSDFNWKIIPNDVF
ncbi:conserved hypothetical protein, secreted [Candidatus Magnetobacterium bavaricum]|uniref:Bacterial repeat domain-containing protein n=1 Tax=Candidatus Magnetobacterium bavaricum TaxID=29290 RepID=A0A0F3GQB0_9BACT|nr:conserved hypothetical protein, secreted [Candidatus Magnetobacterium bavaricum]